MTPADVKVQEIPTKSVSRDELVAGIRQRGWYITDKAAEVIAASRFNEARPDGHVKLALIRGDMFPDGTTYRSLTETLDGCGLMRPRLQSSLQIPYSLQPQILQPLEFQKIIIFNTPVYLPRPSKPLKDRPYVLVLDLDVYAPHLHAWRANSNRLIDRSVGYIVFAPDNAS